MTTLPDDAAVSLMIDCLEAVGPFRAPLVVGERTGRVAAALRATGTPAVWLRRASRASPEPPRPWPPQGAYDGALVRLPKAKDALEMALHAAAAAIPVGAPIAVFGLNAEGIRSAGAWLAAVADRALTVRTGGHSRVIAGRRKFDTFGLRGHLEDWRRVGTIEIHGTTRSWVSYPGTFARGGLDDGTAFLIRHLPSLPPRARVLDFAAGTGVIAHAIAMRAPEARIDLLDADALSIEAAKENVPSATAILGSSLGEAGAEGYDLVVSNPPVHEGVRESRVVLDDLIAGAPRVLRPGGRLLLVVQRRIPVLPAMRAALDEVHVVADDGRFTVAAGIRSHARHHG